MSDRCLSNGFRVRFMSDIKAPGFHADERSERYGQACKCLKLHEQTARELGNAAATAQDGAAATDYRSVAARFQAQSHVLGQREFESPADGQREFCF